MTFDDITKNEDIRYYVQLQTSRSISIHVSYFVILMWAPNLAHVFILCKYANFPFMRWI